jgi:hypothetical protein
MLQDLSRRLPRTWLVPSTDRKYKAPFPPRRCHRPPPPTAASATVPHDGRRSSGVGPDAFERKPKDGPIMTVQTRSTTVFAKTDGQWRVVATHDSPLLCEASAPSWWAQLGTDWRSLCGVAFGRSRGLRRHMLHCPLSMPGSRRDHRRRRMRGKGKACEGGIACDCADRDGALQASAPTGVKPADQWGGGVAGDG